MAKSGSPIPSEITPSIEANRSKNFRIPEGGIRFTSLELINIRFTGRKAYLENYWLPFNLLLPFQDFTILFIPLKHEMGNCPLHLFNRGKLL